jgi:hypothetical protein
VALSLPLAATVPSRDLQSATCTLEHRLAQLRSVA